MTVLYKPKYIFAFQTYCQEFTLDRSYCASHIYLVSSNSFISLTFENNSFMYFLLQRGTGLIKICDWQEGTQWSFVYTFSLIAWWEVEIGNKSLAKFKSVVHTKVIKWSQEHFYLSKYFLSAFSMAITTLGRLTYSSLI